MNKSHIIDAVSKKANITKEKATLAVNEFLASIKGGLSSGEKITLVGFGTFDTAVRKARMGRNPKTGEALAIPEKIAVTFKVGTALKEMVNGSQVTLKEDVIETEVESETEDIKDSETVQEADFQVGEDELENELVEDAMPEASVEEIEG